jgi:hypothetical protein
MAKHSYLKLAVLLLIITGCEEYKYSIEMKSCDEGIERKLTLSGNFPEDQREAIAKLYEKQVAPNIFRGVFVSNLPNDVGGAGFYTTFNTDMGKTTIYSERFRGNDDLNDTLDKAQLQVDRIVDFLIGWLEYELGDDPNFVNLKAFCDKNLRQDLKNVAIYYWLSDILKGFKSDDSDEISIRMMQYFVERGYFSAKEAILLLGDSYELTEETAYHLVRNFVAGKMGYSDPNITAEHLKFLSDQEHAEKSLEQYIRTTDFFMKAWEEKKIKENDPNAEPPETGEVLVSVLEGTWFNLDFFPTKHTVEVKLTCTNEPFYTNGKWDEQSSQVVWLSEIAGDMKLPTFFYASWSEPNLEFQQRHFGQLALSDEDLAQYCLWRENLVEENSKEWDSFILSLNPGEDLQEQLDTFRFSSDRQKDPNEQKSDLAKEPRELILTGLTLEKETKEDTKTGTDEE